MADRQHASVVLILLGLVCQPVLSSTHFLTAAISNSGRISQSPERTPTGGMGIIVGMVVNESREPVASAIVQAFSAGVIVPQARAPRTVPPLMRASGSATTDAEGRFRISGLALGDYLIAAAPTPVFPSGGSAPAQMYATTFYPSTIDDRQAARVSAFSDAATAIQIELVRVPGARLSGSVVSPSGRPTEGMSVRLYHRFGDFGSESSVGVVSARGTFTTPRVPPGWYRLTIGTRPSQSNDGSSEFADKLIEVEDRDREDLSLVLGPGASISGRVVAEAGASVPTPVGLRVDASLTPEQFSFSRPITAPVADNWSFRMTGLSGSYQFTAAADRAPGVVATRITVDGVESPAGSGVELADGAHEVVVFVARREPPKPAVDATLSSGALVEQFKSEKVFWRQFLIAKEIVERHDASILPALVSWLNHENRHLRGNAAFIFAGLGDARGFQIITDILTDRSDRPPGDIAAGNWTLRAQIRADRYYAAHLLGDLRDPRAVPILVPLLQDEEVNSIVPWALGEIGDHRAIGPLIAALDDPSASARVLAIYALEELQAREALPRLTSLLDDHERSNFGAQVSVAAAAKAAIAKLQ